MNEMTAVFAAEPHTVTVGRHFVRDALEAWGLPEISDDAQLGASELLANAVTHAGTDLTIVVRRTDDVVIEVHDRDPDLHRPAPPVVDPSVDHGRGLQIVAAISRDWGISSSEVGKCVWFALTVPEPARGNGHLYSLSEAHSRNDSAAAPGPDPAPSDQARQANGRASGGTPSGGIARVV